jgi:hypothetical protein
MTDEEIRTAYEQYAKDKPFPENLEYETFKAGAIFMGEWTLKQLEFLRKSNT